MTAQVPVTTLTRSALSQFLPNEQAIRWAESLQAAAQSFVSGGGGGGGLTPSGVTPGNYGTNSSVGAFTVDINGILTAAANTPIAITFSQVSGTVPITQGGTGQTTANAALNALLPSQGGNTGYYLQTNGTVCSWQPAPGGGGGGTVTQVNTTAGDLTGGPITVTGTLGLATTGVTAGTYGSASSVPQIAIDTKGRITTASSVTIAITGAQVSGNIAGNAGNVTGVVAVANGGSGATSLTGYLKGNGTSAFTGVASVPAGDVSGTLTVPQGGTGAATLTGYVKGNGVSAFTAAASIPQADVTNLVSDLALKAPLASPAFTGIPAAPTAAGGTNTTQLATTAFVQTAVAGKASSAITITGTLSVSGGGDLTANRTLSLVNDSGAPGSLKYYGTDPSGTKGYFSFPAAGAVTWGSITGTLSAQTDLQAVLDTKVTAVDTIAALKALSAASLVNNQVMLVKGYNAPDDGGGGDFIWDSASTATVNYGTIFQLTAGGAGRWLRMPAAESVNVLWFGADNTASRDTSVDVQRAYDYAVGTPFSREVFFPRGDYICSINLTDNLVELVGASVYSVALSPSTTTGAIFTIADASGTLQPCRISDFTLRGIGTRQGYGIDCASGATAALVRDVYFDNFDACVRRPYGNFQQWYINCTMTTANYHFYSVSSATAQCGSIVVQGGNYGQSVLAHFYFDGGTVQSGQVTYDSNVMLQGNTGYLFFVKAAALIGNSGFNIKAAYNENIPTTSAITVGGVTAVPVQFYLKDCEAFHLDDTIAGSVTLINSHMTTANAEVSYFGEGVGTSIDATSSLQHSNARWVNYSNIPGAMRSVNWVKSSSTGTGAWFQGSQLVAVAKVAGATVHMSNDCSATFNFVGSATTATTSQTNSGIAGLTTVQRLTMTGTQNEQSPDTGATSIAAGRYIVWVWVGKLISGTAPDLYLWGSLVGGTQVSLKRSLVEGEFVTLKGLSTMSAGVSHLAYEFRSTASCVVDMAGLAVVSFSDQAQAIAFLNSNVFPI